MPRASRLLTARIVLAASALWLAAAQAASGQPAPRIAEPRHGIAMHGEPALPDGFAHLPYADPAAVKGGRLTVALQGTFDSLNPFVVKGVAPDAVPRYVLQSLMTRSLDEPFSLYGIVARTVELPEDRTRVAFNLDPRARFADGRPVSAEDVRFSVELLRRHGKPFHRSALAQVREIVVEGPHRIRFELADGQDRELPLLIALLPILPAHAVDPDRFPETTYAAPPGSGPYEVAEVRPGERIVLRRRADWWGADLPVARGLFNFDEIRYDFYRDANSLFEAFKAGLYDFRVEGEPVRWKTGYDIPAVREGRIRLETSAIRAPKGMNAFAFNTRRARFADPRVREALSLVFDFGWVNRNLYFGTLKRSESFFDDSELSSAGRPADARERSLLARFPGAVRDDVLEGRWRPGGADGSGRDRNAARRALALLAQAGWRLREGRLVDARTGEPFAFEIMAISRQQERLALNYAAALARIGVTARIRLVDDVQFWRRAAAFDFDMIQWTWPVSASPGSEQRNRWSSAAAAREGSLNYTGARSPAADAVIDAMLAARTREEFVSAVRALDRVLLSGFYVVPLFYLPDQWLAYDARLKRPSAVPLLGRSLDAWWRGND